MGPLSDVSALGSGFSLAVMNLWGTHDGLDPAGNDRRIAGRIAGRNATIIWDGSDILCYNLSKLNDSQWRVVDIEHGWLVDVKT